MSSVEGRWADAPGRVSRGGRSPLCPLRAAGQRDAVVTSNYSRARTATRRMAMLDFREVGKRLSNWGRWGEEDERGTVNLITPERIVAASQLVKRGAIFDLGIPFDGNGPQPGRGRINPVRLMSETGAQQQFPGSFHYARSEERRVGKEW